jgi:hypothetical protein
VAALQHYFSGAQLVSWRAAYDRRWAKAKFLRCPTNLGNRFPQLIGYLGNHHAVTVGRYDIPGPAIAQGYGCIVILLVYLSATGMRKEKYCWARRKYPATGWLPDDYQIAEDLLLMIDIETRSEE